MLAYYGNVSVAYWVLTPLGCLHKAMMLASLGIDLNCAELALTSGVAILTQTVLLLGSHVLLCGHNAAVLIENQIALDETAGGLIGSSVPNLGARPLQHLVLLAVHVVVTIITAITTFHHFTK